MDFSLANDETLIAFYESVRRQVEADKQAGGRHRLVGASTKKYADTVREEMNRRQMKYTPIDWHL
jgi:site-specific DNA-adenine methylase